MKLKEFELWAFKLPTEEASALSLFSRSVFAHLERHFEPIDTDGIYRVILKLCEDDSRIGSTETSSSVLKYYKKFDFISFNKSNDLEKKEILLNTMQSSLLELSNIYKWDNAKFNDACTKVRDDKFINSYIYSEKWNRSKSLSAKIFCEHDTDAFKCSLLVFDKAGTVILNKHLFEEKPDEFLFNSKLLKVKWLDKRKLHIFNKNHSEEILIDD